MFKLNKQKIETPAVIVREFDHIELEKGLCVFKLKTRLDFKEVTPLADNPKFGEKIEEGFAKTEDVRDFLDGKSQEIKQIYEMAIAPEGFKEYLSEHRFFEAEEKFCDNGYFNNKGVVEKFASGSASVDDLILYVARSHMVFDRHGVLMPMAVAFDYISGHIHNGNYDIKKAREILMKNPRVKPFSGRRLEAHDTLEILPIPHYNRFDGHTSYLKFKFSFAKEEAVLIQKKYKKKENFHSGDILDAVIDLNLLGLNECRVS